MSRATGGISLFALIVALGYGQEAYAQTVCPPSPTVPTATCGLRKQPPPPATPDGWQFIAFQSRAFMLDDTSSKLSIYMNGRPLPPSGPVQSLTVSGTDMTGFYVNGSTGGTANINIEDGAIVDLIEAGGAIRTVVNITVDNSTLNGAQTGHIYDIAAGGNKDFTLGSAIFIDLVDLGAHTINVVNGSQLNGSIVTGGLGGAQTVGINGSTINTGGIYVASLGTNTISVKDSTVDATGSEVAAGLAGFAQRLADAGYPVDIANVDNLAIGLFGTQGTLTLAGSTVTGDVGLLGIGANATYDMSVTGGSRIVGNLVHRGQAPANVNFDASSIIGDIRASNTDVVMQNASTFDGVFETIAGSTSSLLLIDSTWNMTGNSNITNLTNDPSVINFSPPVGDPTLLSSYKTLTVNNYVGEGGQIRLNTYLGGDGSPSDRLVIDGGTATGTTGLLFANTTGPGVLTVGDGILVVDAINGGTTASGAFAGFAAAGPYEYLLYRGGSTPGSENDLFLRSSSQSVPSEPIVPGGDPVPADPSGPGRPRFRQEVSLYAAMPVMARIYGRKIIDTLHERMGGDAQLLGPGKENMPDGAWGRVIGYWGHRDGDPNGILGGGGPEFDFDFGALQTGLDLYRSEYANGQRDNAGLYIAFGRANADVQHNILGRTFKGGENDFDAVSVGGYWTRFGQNNWYLDGVLQGTWYEDMTMTGRRGLRDGETNGFGFAASLEGGYPFQLGGGWQLEPQAQLVYQALDIDDFNDGASDVSYSDTDLLAGRIGARVTQEWDVGGDAKRKFTFWGRADLWYEFLDDPTTEFSSAVGFIPFTADAGDSWATLGIGAALQVADNTSVYGNVNYDVAFDGDADAWEGKLGVKIQW